MKQLTVRGFDDELSECIRREAAEEGISLSKAALRLLRRGAGLPTQSTPSPAKENDSSFDSIIGSMTEEDAQAIREAIAFFHRVDEEKWE